MLSIVCRLSRGASAPLDCGSTPGRRGNIDASDVAAVAGPVNFPAERLPGWLAAIHAWLPPQHAAIVMRGTLTDGFVTTGLGESFAILGAWAVGAWLLTAWLITRRG